MWESLQKNFNDPNADVSFTVADSNMFSGL